MVNRADSIDNSNQSQFLSHFDSMVKDIQEGKHFRPSTTAADGVKTKLPTKWNTIKRKIFGINPNSLDDYKNIDHYLKKVSERVINIIKDENTPENIKDDLKKKLNVIAQKVNKSRAYTWPELNNEIGFFPEKKVNSKLLNKMNKECDRDLRVAFIYQFPVSRFSNYTGYEAIPLLEKVLEKETILWRQNQQHHNNPSVSMDQRTRLAAIVSLLSLHYHDHEYDTFEKLANNKKYEVIHFSKHENFSLFAEGVKNHDLDTLMRALGTLRDNRNKADCFEEFYRNTHEMPNHALWNRYVKDKVYFLPLPPKKKGSSS